jgi:transposase
VDRTLNELDFSSVKRITIGETSARCGYYYVTFFVDADTKRVLFATERKEADILKRFNQF